jgi:uncharacterized phage infection (PIP) family protein YhgE
MKAIVHAVSIVVLLGAAYFTLEHRRKFGEIEEVRLKTISDNKRISANAEAAESELKKIKEALAADDQKREELSQSLASLQSTANTLQREAADLDGTLQTQEDEFTELNKTREEVSAIVKNLGEDITLENLGDKIKEIDEGLKAKQARVEELETLTQAASKALATNRAEIDRLVKREIDRNARVGLNSMEAVVTAVNQDWGFLVIGAGSNSGFTPQTSLLVQRDGRLLGRVTPSAIEPNQTIAEIDFKSISAGVRIQPGDRVILAKPASN